MRSVDGLGSFSDRGLVVAEADADIHMRNDQGLTAFELAEGRETKFLLLRTVKEQEHLKHAMGSLRTASMLALGGDKSQHNERYDGGQSESSGEYVTGPRGESSSSGEYEEESEEEAASGSSYEGGGLDESLQGWHDH